MKSSLIKLDKIIAMAPYGLVVLYRNLYSRYATPRCRFYPSCSQYAMDMLKEKGFFRGIHKIIWRILRCNPFNEGGYDPVK